jgi:hypothetical protein
MGSATLTNTNTMKKYIVSLGGDFLNVNRGFVRLFESAPTFFESEKEALQAVEKFAANFLDFVEVETVEINI